MQTALIAINTKYIHPNMAIRLLKANTNHPVDLIEFNHKHSMESMVNFIQEKDYNVLAFSCYIWNIEIIKELIDNLKDYINNKNITVILGGPEVSYNAEYYIKNYYADFVIKNEGEEAFDLLLSHLIGKIELTSVPNLYHKDGFTFDKLVDIKNSKMAYDLLDDVSNKIVYIETSRGCPYHCGYCMASLDNKLRFFDIEEIKRQILILIERGAKVFKFLDRTFNAHKKNFISLLDFIILHHKEGNSFQFEITGDLLDDDVIDYINKHAPRKLFRFEIGIQSTNVLANRAVYRIQNNEKLFHNIRLIQDADIIDLHLDLIAGLPYEDYDSFVNTFNEVISLRPKELQLGFLKLLKGTKLYQEKERYGYKFNTKAPYDIICNDFMSEADIEKIHVAEEALDIFYNKKYFKDAINHLLDNTNNQLELFYEIGNSFNNTTNIMERFKFLDLFVKNNYPNCYDEFHKKLILDYISFIPYKPAAWWSENITPKDRNDLLRKYHEAGLLKYDLKSLFKYTLVIPLKSITLVIYYKDNNKEIYTL